MKNIFILSTLLLLIFSCKKKQVEIKSMHVPEPDISDFIYKSDVDKEDTTKYINKKVPEIIINKTPSEAFKNISKETVKKPKKAILIKPNKVAKENPKVLNKTPKVLKDKIITDTFGLIYTVQIGASVNKDKKYSKINNVITYQENSLTKYSLGSFKTFSEARKYRLQIIKKYKGAFVKGLRNNVPVSIR